jgi:prepilin-type N-terminal cleavage/methylation domain-containing protein/prepilin-type processing-associated H-X9-DG protein
MQLKAKNRAFTLVELLVVIAIIGILVALLLPAIQAAREAARRTECGNKMKQLGIAMQNYHDTYKAFPALGTRGMGEDVGWYFSWVIPILPYIEQAQMHDAIMARARPNGAGLPTPWNTGNDGTPGTYGPLWRETNWKRDLQALRCPSDTLPPDRGESPSFLNYRVCVGDDYHQNHFRPDQSSRQNRGIFQCERWVNMSAIIDGTSTTVMLGELVGGGDARDVLGGVAVNVQTWDPANCMARVDPLAPNRLAGDVRAQFRPPGGRAMDGRPYFVGFATMVGPNGPSCHWGGVDGNEHMGTVSSRHPGGAHVTMADGAVKFINQNIDTGAQSVPDIDTPGGRESPWGVWGALGSMAGGEAVPKF